jgi:hypothetical protein
MLVDALADGRTLWPPRAPPLRIAFMPEDALFCASRLLEWVEHGGPLSRRALTRGDRGTAAARARDDDRSAGERRW